MDKTLWREHRGANTVQTLLLLAAMCLLLGVLGWTVGGVIGASFALALGIALAAMSGRMGPGLVLAMYKAQPISAQQAPGLLRLVEELARRAELPAVPRLHYVPSKMNNAFAIGHVNNAAIAVTDGLIRTLDYRELAGVIAHEMSHIAHRDLRVMGLADLFSRLTGTLSTVGKLMLVLGLFGAVFTNIAINWWSIGLLLFAPMLSSMLQLALSRTREYDADLGAAALTGDPEGLASALRKLERHHSGLFEQVLAPGRRVPDPSVLRTHPPTDDRVKRLLALRGDSRLPSMPEPISSAEAMTNSWPAMVPARRRAQLGARALGVWY